ncbi:MAG: hypothetical protein KAR79_05330 [Simkaniaceae bacterium]|nr:hypothetical protein [Simkaniaceae bacterium]
MDKNFVKESDKTQKMRQKLQSRLEAIDKSVTKKALDKKLLEIHSWIARHASSRVVLHNKTISLFDENQNTAKLSNKVSALVKKMQQ